MTLFGGEGTSTVSNSNGDAVYEDFGPFNIGPGVKEFGNGGVSGIR